MKQDYKQQVDSLQEKIENTEDKLEETNSIK